MIIADAFGVGAGKGIKQACCYKCNYQQAKMNARMNNEPNADDQPAYNAVLE
jgi:hypothetical protein